ncbi:MAG: methylated-DNA-protein-cysteine methyltransferase related protein [Bacteroidota bacterium]|nr:methylated-DNA-protein-cysteine methyltransferase related protein [Bacteroidota bacterium]
MKIISPARHYGEFSNQENLSSQVKSAKVNKDFFESVYEIVKLIPFGKVTTYGYIGSALGMKSSARTVGWALNSAAGTTDIPCHRVVNRKGELTGKLHFGSPSMMKELLEAEKIEFIGEAVNLKKHLWIPEIS